MIKQHHLPLQNGYTMHHPQSPIKEQYSQQPQGYFQQHGNGAYPQTPPSATQEHYSSQELTHQQQAYASQQQVTHSSEPSSLMQQAMYLQVYFPQSQQFSIQKDTPRKHTSYATTSI